MVMSRYLAETLGLRKWSEYMGKLVVYVTKPFPLIGNIAFGLIDRGTNVIQVRPTTICPISCIFCSVDSGPLSKRRQTEYIVDYKWLVKQVEEVARFKGGDIQVLIDGVGDPFTYPWLPRLVKFLKDTGIVKIVAAETHGATLTREQIDKLDEAGLDRINLSIETFNVEKARRLASSEWFNVRKIIKLAEYIVKETNIDLHVTPVWLPGINDKDVIEIVKWAYRIGAGKRWPPATIQKFIYHKWGRKPSGVREISWNRYWRWIRSLEKELGVKVSWSMKEWGMRYARKIAHPFKKGNKLETLLAGPGWLRGEYLVVDNLLRRNITVVGLRSPAPREKIYVEIIRDKDGIFLARPL